MCVCVCVCVCVWIFFHQALLYCYSAILCPVLYLTYRYPVIYPISYNMTYKDILRIGISCHLSLIYGYLAKIYSLPYFIFGYPALYIYIYIYIYIYMCVCVCVCVNILLSCTSTWISCYILFAVIYNYTSILAYILYRQKSSNLAYLTDIFPSESLIYEYPDMFYTS